MRFKVDMGGTTMLLTDKQLAAVVRAIDGAERIEDKYVGSDRGTGRGNYLKLIRSMAPSESFRVNVMSATEYEAMKLVTKLEDEKE